MMVRPHPHLPPSYDNHRARAMPALAQKSNSKSAHAQKTTTKKKTVRLTHDRLTHDARPNSIQPLLFFLRWSRPNSSNPIDSNLISSEKLQWTRSWRRGVTARPLSVESCSVSALHPCLLRPAASAIWVCGSREPCEDGVRPRI